MDEWGRIPRVAIDIAMLVVSSHSLGQVNETTSPVRLDLGRLRANLLRNWLDFVEFDPHSLVG